MKTTPSTKKARDATPIILRLERNNTEISTLRDKLSSYVCEPKTHSLFEHLENLKIRLEKMRKSNLEVIGVLKEQKGIDVIKDRIRNQLSEFKELEDHVFEYIGMARMHC